MAINPCNPWLINDLRASNALYNCKETFTDVRKTLQINLFMQNKANFQKVKLNVNKELTKDYDKMDTWSIGKTKPIQSQLKPIQSQSNPIKANKIPKQTQFKAKQSHHHLQGNIIVTVVPLPGRLIMPRFPLFNRIIR